MPFGISFLVFVVFCDMFSFPGAKTPLAEWHRISGGDLRQEERVVRLIKGEPDAEAVCTKWRRMNKDAGITDLPAAALKMGRIPSTAEDTRGIPYRLHESVRETEHFMV